MQVPEIITQAIQSGTGVSEKRISRMVIVTILLALTCVDFFANKMTMRWEIFSTWLGFAGYDGYRISAEKKFERKTETNLVSGEQIFQKKTQTKQGGSTGGVDKNDSGDGSVK